jgi:hypothetical protein
VQLAALATTLATSAMIEIEKPIQTDIQAQR